MNHKGTPTDMIGEISIENDNVQMAVDNKNPAISDIQNPRPTVRLNKAPKSSAERGREFRARIAYLKQQRKQRLKRNSINEITTEDTPSAGGSEDNQFPGSSEIWKKEKRAKAAEATRRWRQKKRGDLLKKQPKSGAERMREYRLRRKIKHIKTQNLGDSEIEVKLRKYNISSKTRAKKSIGYHERKKRKKEHEEVTSDSNISVNNEQASAQVMNDNDQFVEINTTLENDHADESSNHHISSESAPFPVLTANKLYLEVSPLTLMKPVQTVTPVVKAEPEDDVVSESGDSLPLGLVTHEDRSAPCDITELNDGLKSKIKSEPDDDDYTVSVTDHLRDTSSNHYISSESAPFPVLTPNTLYLEVSPLTSIEPVPTVSATVKREPEEDEVPESVDNQALGLVMHDERSAPCVKTETNDGLILKIEYEPEDEESRIFQKDRLQNTTSNRYVSSDSAPFPVLTPNTLYLEVSPLTSITMEPDVQIPSTSSTPMETDDIVPPTSAIPFAVPHTPRNAKAQRQSMYRKRKAAERTPAEAADFAKAAAERQRRCKQRRLANSALDTGTLESATVSAPVVVERTVTAQTSAQRQRAYRQRRAAQIVSQISTPPTHTAVQPEQSTWNIKWSSSK